MGGSLSSKIQDVGGSLSSVASTKKREFTRFTATEHAKPASSSGSAALKPKAKEAATPKASGGAAKSGSEPANSESAAVLRMKKLLETL
jgi:hypothetical protein